MKRAFINGKIFTVNKNQPWASAVVVDDKKIIYVGDDNGAKKYIDKDTKVEDLGSKLMTPGLIDGHLHALMATLIEVVILFPHSKDIKEVQSIIKDYMKKNPDLPAYLGMGWDDGICGEEGPNKKDLDAICPDKPIMLLSASGHCGWANSKALETANITKDTKDPDPKGGHLFYRDKDGNPTGYIKETICTNMILSKAEYIPLKLLGEAAVNLGKRCASYGFTSLVDCGNYDFFEFIMNDDLQAEIEHPDCPVRITACGLIANSANIENAFNDSVRLSKKYHSDNFKVSFLKILNDGTLENFSAAYPNPFPGAPSIQPTFNVDQLVYWGEKCAKAGLDLNVHAIGSITVHELLEAAGILRNKGYKDMRIMCSHSAYVFPDDLDKFAKYNVVANSTGSWFSAIPAEEADSVYQITQAKSYPMKSIKNAGGRLSLSSDYPTDVNAFHPMPNIEVALTRQPIGDSKATICEPEERLTLEDIIEAYTLNNAYEMRLEDKIGSIEVGKYADLTIYEQNLFEIDPYTIHDVKIYETIMDGVTRYKKD